MAGIEQTHKTQTCKFQLARLNTESTGYLSSRLTMGQLIMGRLTIGQLPIYHHTLV